MKKTVFLLLALCLSLGSIAQDVIPQQRPTKEYLRGAVPMQDGQVSFQKSFRVNGKTDAQILTLLNEWMQKQVDQSIPAPGQYARMMGTEDQQSTARICHWLVFKKHFLNLDRARMRFVLEANVQEGRVTLRANQIAYYYGEDMEGSGGQQYHAEEWISDEAAVNAKNTKLLPKSGKFRIHTVDYMQKLFEGAMDVLNEDVKTAQPVAKPVEQPKRKNIVEE